MNLLDCLSAVKNPRGKQVQRFELHKLLLFNYYDHDARLLPLPGDCPFLPLPSIGFTPIVRHKKQACVLSCDFRQLILSLDFISLQVCFYKWTRQYVPIEENEWISIDGKAIKSTVSDS